MSRNSADRLRDILECIWRAIKGLRDLLGHEYFRIVPKIVHATVRESLDPLETAATKLLARFENEPPIGPNAN